MTEMTHAAAEMTTDFTELPTAIEKPMKLFRGILHKLVGKKENTR